MANDLNRVMMIGRLTKDPELKHIPTGTAVTSFSIASNRSNVKNGEKTEQVSYFECIAWGKLGEIIAQYQKKGSLIGLDGRLQQRSWDDKEGKKRYKVEIVVENVQFLGGKSENSIVPKEAVKGFHQQHKSSDDNPFSDDEVPF